MPWYIGDFLRDTMHLDHVADGAYRRLIDACWVQKGTLPDDNFLLARITKLSPHLWKKIRPIMEKFFTVDEAGWRHKRVTAELEIALTHMDNLSRRGVTGAKVRWGEAVQQASSAHATSNAKPMLADAPSPSPSPVEESLRESSLPYQTQSPQSNGSAVFANDSQYAFRGKLIRLTWRDFRQWQDAYSAIADLSAKLTSLDDYYDQTLRGGERRKWFVRCSAALRNDHEAALRGQRRSAEIAPNEGLF